MMIRQVEYRDGLLYCARHVALVKLLWKEQTYLMHPAYWCPVCKGFVASDAVPEEARREVVNPMQPLVHGKGAEL